MGEAPAAQEDLGGLGEYGWDNGEAFDDRGDGGYPGWAG